MESSLPPEPVQQKPLSANADNASCSPAQEPIITRYSCPYGFNALVQSNRTNQVLAIRDSLGQFHIPITEDNVQKAIHVEGRIYHAIVVPELPANIATYPDLPVMSESVPKKVWGSLSLVRREIVARDPPASMSSKFQSMLKSLSFAMDRAQAKFNRKAKLVCNQLVMDLVDGSVAESSADAEATETSGPKTLEICISPIDKTAFVPLIADPVPKFDNCLTAEQSDEDKQKILVQFDLLSSGTEPWKLGSGLFGQQCRYRTQVFENGATHYILESENKDANVIGFDDGTDPKSKPFPFFREKDRVLSSLKIRRTQNMLESYPVQLSFNTVIRSEPQPGFDHGAVSCPSGLAYAFHADLSISEYDLAFLLSQNGVPEADKKLWGPFVRTLKWIDSIGSDGHVADCLPVAAEFGIVPIVPSTDADKPPKTSTSTASMTRTQTKVIKRVHFGPLPESGPRKSPDVPHTTSVVLKHYKAKEKKKEHAFFYLCLIFLILALFAFGAFGMYRKKNYGTQMHKHLVSASAKKQHHIVMKGVDGPKEPECFM